MDVDEVHEVDVGLRVVLVALVAAAARAVGHGRRVRARVHDEHRPLELALGRRLPT